MLCERCNHQVNPVVAVDIDGTIAEYHATLFMFIFQYFDLSPRILSECMAENNLVCLWDGSGNFEDFIGISSSEYREGKLAFRQGGHKRWMPVYPESRLMIDTLHEAGAEVWFTTTRPWQRLDNVDPDTREWLRRKGFGYQGLLYDEDKYAKLIDIVGADRVVAVIDDLPEMVIRARDLGLYALQVARIHNSHAGQLKPPRVSLTTATSITVKRISEWRMANDR
jgi:hypothetical protein